MGAGCSTSSVSPAETKQVKKVEKEIKQEQNEETKMSNNKVERFGTASSGNGSFKTVTTNADTDATEDSSYRRPNYRITDAMGYPSRLMVEPIRLILHYANQPYEEMAIPQDQFAYEDWGIRLPVMQVADAAPGQMIAGPIAIARFLAETYDLVSDDDDAWLCAQMDALVEIYEEMCKEVLQINRQPKAMQVTWADLAVSDFFAFLVDKYDSTLLVEYPALAKHIESIRAIPDIAEYISTRIELAK